VFEHWPCRIVWHHVKIKKKISCYLGLLKVVMEGIMWSFINKFKMVSDFIINFWSLSTYQKLCELMIMMGVGRSTIFQMSPQRRIFLILNFQWNNLVGQFIFLFQKLDLDLSFRKYIYFKISSFINLLERLL